MKTSELLTRLRTLGIKVWVEGAELKLKAPKGALTPELRDHLVASKQEMISLLRPASAADVAVIPKADRKKPLQLSFTQQRLWFLDQMEPGVITYNMWTALILHGELDVDALERSLDEICRRHEVLRATFQVEAGVPHQVIDPDFRIRLERLSHASGDMDQEGVKALLLARLEVPFDLARGPMVRATLVQRGPEEHVLILVVHHIVFDGLSTSLFFQELNQIYPAFAAEKPSPLPELEVQYPDYAAWQRDLLEGDELERRMGYWRETLGGAPPVLELPIDKPRPATQTFDGEVESLWFDDAIPSGTEALANREGSTFFLVMLAAYQAFLYRITGQEDVLVGTAMANRTRPEVQKMLGYFVNTLVLRTDVSGAPTFRELLGRARDTFFGAVEHQDMPFERLVDELQPERNLAFSPLFQTLIVLDQDAGQDRTMGAIEMQPFVLDNRQARTDLVVHAYRGRDDQGVPGRLKVGFEYNTDLFSQETVERLLRCYERILAGAIQDPDARISEIPMLPDEERVRVVEEWNATSEPFSQDPIHVQFEARVDASPEAPALVFPGAKEEDDESFSYRELDQAANRLAQHLISRGVKPGTLVGLSLDRSSEMVVALLAILKTGAAYVPLDPSYPSDRLAYMIEDSGLTVLVTTSELRPLLPREPVAIELDVEEGAISACSSERPALAIAATERMYVIYTSGSTGRPKGVELEHRSVSNFLMTMAQRPGMKADDRLLTVTTLSFDISVLEVMLPLLNGATLLVAPREAVGDGKALLALIERLEPSVLQATPATWRMLLLSDWTGTSGLKALCGGEALPRELADDLLPRVGELWNVYGPTETTIWSSVKRVEPGTEPITIGTPIANTKLYVLDPGLQPVPTGVPGELWIGGDGLARGYLERPELTAERFVPDPFVGGQARMYRTGDKARWLSSGEVECLGRIDNQVKLRGFRIELGEIEAVVGDVAGVTQCVCVIREDTPGDQRLTAYVVPGPGASIDTGLARDACQKKLPAYMVPAAFIELAELPHTPNGKVDTKALQALDPVRPKAASRAEIVPPRNENERRVAAVWSSVLGVEEVSIDVNFFDLGGHSLLLAQVRSGIAEALGVDLTIIELFQFPTVGQLATRVAEKQGSDAASTKRPRSSAPPRKTLLRRRRR